MTRLRPPLATVAMVVLCPLLMGCPTVTLPSLFVSVEEVDFGTIREREIIGISTEGTGNREWTAEIHQDGALVDLPYLTLEAPDGSTGSSVTGTAGLVVMSLEVLLDRSVLFAEPASPISIEITSGTQEFSIPISISIETVDPVVSPVSISIPIGSDDAIFTIDNSAGQESVDWTLTFLEDPEDLDSEIPQPFYVISVGLQGSVGRNTTADIRVVIDRRGLAEQAHTTYLLFSFTGQILGETSVVVQFTFSVGESGLFVVTPDEIVVPVNSFATGGTLTRTFTIANPPSGNTLVWNLRFEDGDDPGVSISAPSFLGIGPSDGELQPGQEVLVTIDVLKAEVVGRTALDILIEVAEGPSSVVRLQIDTIEGPRLSIRQEPVLRTSGVLDFGTGKDVMALAVGNTGGDGTLLNFRIETNNPDLILLPQSAAGKEGSSTGLGECSVFRENDFFFCFDWVDFAVVINREAMKEGAMFDGGEITITPTGPTAEDREEQPEIKIAVSVMRAPLRMEGAQNRARPPYLQRFIFLMRDSLTHSIDTLDLDTFRDITFSITEGARPLDLKETNAFVTGPHGLRTDVVLILDFTGSVYRSDEDDGVPHGALIDEMVEASKALIDDLPDAYRISLMEFHERAQDRRVIHTFSTSKDELKDSLDAFAASLGPYEHGESDMFDAMAEAVANLVDQDPGKLPFDEADVRALILLSDGNDSSSSANLGTVTSAATEARVRIFPVALGEAPDLANMIQLAADTGGHSFQAIGERSMAQLLGEVDGEGNVTRGQIWADLERQIVLTFMTLLEGSGSSTIRATYLDPSFGSVSGSFEAPGVSFPGDVRAGQISLMTTGIDAGGRADIFVRADYIPRSISELRFRFVVPPDRRQNLILPPDLLVGEPSPFRRDQKDMFVIEDADGLLSGWRLISEADQGERIRRENVFTIVTDEASSLPIGSFGNLMRLRFEGLDPADRFDVGFRVDNTLYARSGPEDLTNPRFFLYPGGHANPNGLLAIGPNPAFTGPAETVEDLQDTTFDPEADFAFDRDEDGIPDFDDPAPGDEDFPASIASRALVVFNGTDAGGNPVILQSFTITNNRLDEMTWNIVVPEFAFDLRVGFTDVPEGLPLPLPDSAVGQFRSGTLMPGESAEVYMTVDRRTLEPGEYASEIAIVANLILDPVPMAVTIQVLE